MLLGAAEAGAAEVWVGDFETGDLSQWGFVLNGEVGGMAYAFAQQRTVAEGTFAGRLELHNDAVWPNGLKRVELQHRPADARTAEGATTWFAWSFYLPEALPEDPSQQIGYWESNNTFQQVMAFEVEGETIAFYTRRPNNVEQWQANGVVTAGQWHRIAMGVTWSTNPGMGAVDVWFDGMQVVDQGPAQTLADDNPHFVQLGLLRGAIEFQDLPIIIVDDAVEGDSLQDVRPDDLPSEGDDSSSSGGGVDTSGGMSDDTTTGGGIGSTGDLVTTGSPATGGGPGGNGSGGTAGTGGTDPAADDDAEGCGCRSQPAPGSAWALGLLALLGWRRRARAA